MTPTKDEKKYKDGEALVTYKNRMSELLERELLPNMYSIPTAYVAPYLSLAYLAYLSYLILREAWFKKSQHRHHICPRVNGTYKDRIQAMNEKNGRQTNKNGARAH